MNNKKDLIISDMEGTFLFSEKTILKAFKIILKENNIEKNNEDLMSYYGMSYPIVLSKLISDLTEERLQSILERKKQLIKENISLCHISKSMLHLLNSLKSSHHIALATNASKDYTQSILDHFDLHSTFDYVITGDDVSNPKPDPECYSTIINHFNIPKENVLVLEDSIHGKIAAEKAGAKVLYVGKVKDN